MVSNAELKKNAREQLGGSIFQNNWLMMLLACLIVTVLTSAASVVFFVGSLIVVGPLGYGLARVMTDRVRGKERIELGDTFKGFTENFGGSLILGLLQSIFIALWSLLLVVSRHRQGIFLFDELLHSAGGQIQGLEGLPRRKPSNDGRI